MGGVSDRAIQSEGPWPAGMNNVAREATLPADEDGRRISFREADNLDFDNVGWPRTRRGWTPVFLGNLTHSLWSHDELPFGLFADDGVLHCFRNPDDTSSLGRAVGSNPISYRLIDDRIYFSNRTVSGVVTPDLQVLPWAPVTPVGQPAAAPVDGFGLRAGTYQFAITYVDGLGRESGAQVPVAIEVQADQGIHLTAIPQPPADADIELIRVYVSPPNDGVLKRYQTLPVGTTEAFVTSDSTGKVLTTQDLRDMPPCQFIDALNGRLIGASGRELIWSEALRYGSYHAVRDRVRFSDEIDLLVAVGSGTAGAGVFVGAGKRTYWLPAVIGEDRKLSFSLSIAHSAGAVPGTGQIVPAEVLGQATGGELAMWLSRAGTFCVGAPGGAVTPLNVDQVALNSADRGAVMLRQQEGIHSLVAALRGPRRNGLAFSDQAVAHVIHQDP